MYENFQGTRSGRGHGSKKSRIHSRRRKYGRHRVTVVDTVASVVVTMLGMRARRR